MKHKIQKIFKFSVISLFVLAVMPLTNVDASGKSIGLRPLKNDISIQADQEITRTITIVNNTKESVEAIPTLETFSQSDEKGYPTKMEAGDPNNIQDATNWIDISREPVTVPPFSTYEVEYKIKAPADAEPGGHYAAILYEPYDPNPSDGIKIKVRVASLLLVRVAGDVLEDAEIADFDLNKNKVYDDQPLVFNVSIKNTGNVHFKPEGRIVLKDAEGKILQKVAKIIDKDGQEKTFNYIPVNYKGGHLLPQSTRLFEGKWDNPVYNEEITAELGVAYSDIKEPLRKTFKFTLNRALEVKDFDFDLMGRVFTLVLKNNGNVLVKPLGGIKIFNAFDFQVDELAIPENETYLKQGEERTFKFDWSKEVPNGKYKAMYEYAGDLDDLTSEPIVFVIGNPVLAMLMSTQGIVLGGVLLIIIVLAIVLRKKSNKSEK